jgi:hypothetical protein
MARINLAAVFVSVLCLSAIASEPTVESAQLPGMTVRATTWPDALKPEKYGGVKLAFDGQLYGNEGWYVRNLPGWIEVEFDRPRTVSHVAIYHGGEDWSDNLALRDFQIQRFDFEKAQWTNLAPPIVGNSESILESHAYFNGQEVKRMRLLITGGHHTGDGGWCMVRELVIDNKDPANADSPELLLKSNAQKFVVRRDRYSLFGMHDSGDFVMQPKLFEQVLALYSQAGVKNFVYGCGGQPLPGVSSYSHMDRWVDQARRHGMNLSVQWVRTEWWNSSAPGSVTDIVKRGAWSPRDKQMFAEQVSKLTEHFKDRVDIWEWRNEVNFDFEWASTPKQYVDDLRTFQEAAKRGNPECQVMSAGICSGRSMFRKLMELDMDRYCDIIGYHPYRATPNATVDEVNSMRAIMARHGCFKPIWNGEVGGFSTGQRGVHSESVKAEFIPAMFEGLKDKVEVAGYWVGAGTVPTAWKNYQCTAGVVFFNGKHLQILPAYDTLARLAHGDTENLGILNLGEDGADAKREPLPSWVCSAGASISRTIRFRNTGKVAQRFNVAVTGIDPKWVQLDQHATPVEPGAEGVATLVVNVPDYVPTGVYSFSYRAQSSDANHFWLGDTRVAQLVVTNQGRARQLNMSDWDLASGVLSPVGVKQPWVVPGASMELNVAISNAGSAPERITVSIDDLPAQWVELPKPQSLEPGAKSQVVVRLRVPADVKPGEYAYTLRVSATDRAEVCSWQEGIIEVLPATIDQVNEAMDEFRKSLEANR